MAQAFTVENLISNWNEAFPNHHLTAADLKNPHAVMKASFQVLDRLGIDMDAVLMAPQEENSSDHTAYYRDLLPVINTTRVINHLVSVMPQVATISVTHFLQPTSTTSHSILLLLFNFMLFNEERLRDIAPHEEELFAKTDEVKTLEDRKNKLLEMLNEQAEQKGKREERLEKLNEDIQQFEDELKPEKEAHDLDKQELEAVLKENHQIEVVLEQKKGVRDAILAEVARKRALRVYDADDIKTQAEQAAQNVQEAEEKLNTLRATLMEKENRLKNLQTIKPSLDTANNLLHEIMKMSESLKDYESGDLDSDSKEGELEMLNTELSELAAAVAELRTARHDATRRHHDAAARRQREREHAKSALREAEEKDKKNRERFNKALQRTQEIKEATAKYEESKAQGLDELAKMKEAFTNGLIAIEEALLKKVTEAEKRIEDKLRNRNL